MSKTKYNNFCKHKPIDDMENSTDKVLSLIEKTELEVHEKDYIGDYCRSCINNITYTEEDQTIYDFYIKNIIKYLNAEGKITKDDLRTVIQYLMLKKVKDLNLNACFRALHTCVFSFKYSPNCDSFFITKVDGQSVIYFRNTIFRGVVRKDNCLNVERLIKLLQLLYYEISKTYQNHMVAEQLASGIENKNVLFWIKENAVDNYYYGYYFRYFPRVSFQREATIKGNFMAMDTICEYFDYLDKDVISKFAEDIVDYYYICNIKHIDPETGYEELCEDVKTIDSHMDLIALDCPAAVYEMLNIQYQPDGQRKTSVELMGEYCEKKSLIDYEYEVGSEVYDNKMASLKELYDYLIGSAKRREIDDCYQKLMKTNTGCRK
ncbi:MAG: hypothetical protein PHS98_01430 [Bacilli bacterium]|nr:hypothetical protein [Bacilli bacterium]